MGPVILIILIIVLFLIKSKKAELKGRYSEHLVSNKLSGLPDEYNIFNNLLFNIDGHSTQIDHVVVSPYGVFVIETKGYKGWILGSENSEYWTQVIYKTKHELYNPIKQNNGHVLCLRKVLETSYAIPFIPIIVFNNSARIKVHNSNYIVINRRRLKSTILSFNTKALTQEQVNWIINKLHASYEEGSKEEVKSHVSQVRNIEHREKELIKMGICPHCGGKLVLRHGKYGYFYGCINYPKCRFTIKK